MKLLCRTLFFIALFFAAGTTHAADILIAYVGNIASAQAAVMQTNLAADGHTVDVADTSAPGALATALGAKAYDQVYLWDVTTTPTLNVDDLSAISGFWDTHRGLVVDTRSYGYHFQGNNASEIALLRNVANVFVQTGGGVWVGTDHDNWAQNGNLFLASIAVNDITGSYSDPVNYADASSVLLDGVTPADLWGAGQSVGQAPHGVQPNGVEMFIHFGHIRSDETILPYISASFPLAGPDDEPRVDAVSVPVPALSWWALAVLVTLIALVGLMFTHRTLRIPFGNK